MGVRKTGLKRNSCTCCFLQSQTFGILRVETALLTFSLSLYVLSLECCLENVVAVEPTQKQDSFPFPSLFIFVQTDCPHFSSSSSLFPLLATCPSSRCSPALFLLLPCRNCQNEFGFAVSEGKLGFAEMTKKQPHFLYS